MKNNVGMSMLAIIVLVGISVSQVCGENYTAINLNPSGFDFSMAYGTSGTQQAGFGYGSATSYYNHALLWNGSATSFVDLSQLLPTGFHNSYANSIDSYGNIAGYAIDNSGNYSAILWVVPEPATICLFALAGLMLRNKK